MSASPPRFRPEKPHALPARGWTHSHFLGDFACEEGNFFLDALVVLGVEKRLATIQRFGQDTH
jgi:hypothetical protein